MNFWAEPVDFADVWCQKLREAWRVSGDVCRGSRIFSGDDLAFATTSTRRSCDNHITPAAETS
jgi:hypothetical protein